MTPFALTYSFHVVPHIGHLYSTVIADILARWEMIRNPFRQVLYTTGTDEHGLKIQQAAKEAGISPLELCDSTSQRFKVCDLDLNHNY
jgi:methionyl-tRNA synthetase